MSGAASRAEHAPGCNSVPHPTRTPGESATISFVNDGAELVCDLSMIPAWLPVAIAVGSVGYAVYATLAGRSPQVEDTTETTASAGPVLWPSDIDRRYFESEMHLASKYIELARSTRVEADSRECLARAADIHADLATWIRCRGGDAEFEAEVKRLQWQIDAACASIIRDY